MQQHNFTLSRDRWIAGVCGGIAEYLNWSPSATRLTFLVASLLTGALPGLLLYTALAMIMPPPPPRGFKVEDFRR